MSENIAKGLIGDLSGIKIILSPYLPENTIMVSPDVWELLKKTIPAKEEGEPK